MRCPFDDQNCPFRSQICLPSNIECNATSMIYSGKGESDCFNIHEIDINPPEALEADQIEILVQRTNPAMPINNWWRICQSPLTFLCFWRPYTDFDKSGYKKKTSKHHYWEGCVIFQLTFTCTFWPQIEKGLSSWKRFVSSGKVFFLTDCKIHISKKN